MKQSTAQDALISSSASLKEVTTQMHIVTLNPQTTLVSNPSIVQEQKKTQTARQTTEKTSTISISSTKLIGQKSTHMQQFDLSTELADSVERTPEPPTTESHTQRSVASSKATELTTEMTSAKNKSWVPTISATTGVHVLMPSTITHVPDTLRTTVRTTAEISEMSTRNTALPQKASDLRTLSVTTLTPPINNTSVYVNGTMNTSTRSNTPKNVSHSTINSQSTQRGFPTIEAARPRTLAQNSETTSIASKFLTTGKQILMPSTVTHMPDTVRTTFRTTESILETSNKTTDLAPKTSNQTTFTVPFTITPINNTSVYSKGTVNTSRSQNTPQIVARSTNNLQSTQQSLQRTETETPIRMTQNLKTTSISSNSLTSTAVGFLKTSLRKF